MTYNEIISDFFLFLFPIQFFFINNITRELYVMCYFKTLIEHHHEISIRLFFFLVLFHFVVIKKKINKYAMNFTRD